MRVSAAHRKLADDAYEAVAARSQGRIDALDAVASTLKKALPAVDTALLVEQYVAQLVAGADERALARGRSPQIGLFDGTPVALDGFFATGDGKRVKVRAATAADWVTLLQLKGDNLAAVQHEHAEWLTAYGRLLPWLSQGLTTEQALAAYRAATGTAPAVVTKP